MVLNNRLKHIFLYVWQKKEAFIWLGALTFIAFSNPETHHYSLCPLDNLGLSFCPGCGLGRSIGYLFRMDFETSFLAHPLGIPAVVLLIYRSVKLFFTSTHYKLSTI